MSELKCERCFVPLAKDRPPKIVWFLERDTRTVVDTKGLCDDCYEIVKHAASPDSCGDPKIRKMIQDTVLDPPKRMSKKNLITLIRNKS